jgi:molecular chaperone GrpE
VSKKDPTRRKPDPAPPPGEAADRDQAPDDAVDELVTEELAYAGDQALREGCEGCETHATTDPDTAKLDDLRAELEQAKDRALRSHAELENYRKRVARQVEEERRYANMAFIRDLLPVWDNIGRAIEAAESTHQTASLLEGFKMVAGQLEDVLERHQCTKIDAQDEPFDPNLHEAICQQPSEAHPANTVLQVTQTGFRLHDRVVRPAQVIVSAAAPQDKDSADTQPEEPKDENSDD